MRTSLYWVSGIVLALLSCSKSIDITEPFGSEEMYFYAVSGDMPESRTVLQPDGSVYWCPFDSIKVFQGDLSSGLFISQNALESATVKFKGHLDVLYGAIETGEQNSYYWAINPYSTSASCDGTSLSLTIPNEQVGHAGSFEPGAFPSIAKSQNQMLAFYNICGGMKITVSQKGIKEISISGNNNETLAGDVSVSFDDNGKPFVQSIKNATKVITLTSPSESGFDVDTPYYVSIIPTNLANGFSITYAKGLTRAVYETSTSVTVNRSRFGVVSNKDEGLSFNYKDGYIEFVDRVAEAACVERFDINHDGHVSYEEAGAVTSLDKLFEEYPGVESFAELRFFENVTDLAGAFTGCYKLKSIRIPESVTIIGNSAFEGCSALEEIEFHGGITRLGDASFKDCISLEKISLNESLASIGDSAFSGCSKLVQVHIPQYVSSIGSGAFSDATRTIYMKGVTPPSISSDSFGMETIFFVPYISLDIYKAKKNWGSHEEYIYPEVVDLSKESTSNCYIVSSPNAYQIKTVMGNSQSSVGSVASVDVLWESFGTNVKPNQGDIVKVVAFDNDNIIFWHTGKRGNALIAAKDASGTILWSWHIWCTDPPIDQTYPNNAGIMMDRNLGATSATPGEPAALGLLYQWGRKDPFLSSSDITTPTEALSTLTWPSPVTVNSSVGTISYATQHPTTFILRTLGNPDWMYSPSSYAAVTRWLKSKTVYDPCPNGYHVPAGDETGVWATAMSGTSSYYGELIDGVGVSFSVLFNMTTDLCWYPFVFAKDRYTGELTAGGAYWSYSPSTQGSQYNAYTMNVYTDGGIAPNNGVNVRSRCFSIRCQKIE